MLDNLLISLVSRPVSALGVLHHLPEVISIWERDYLLEVPDFLVKGLQCLHTHIRVHTFADLFHFVWFQG